jgi:hypothetical protein
MHESKIISELKKSLRYLLPVEDLRIDFKSKRSKDLDAVAQIDFRGLNFELVIEAISSASLPLLKNKIYRLKAAAAENGRLPVLVAPYLSPERQALCRESGVYYIDLSGNVFLAYGSFYVEKSGFPNKFPEKRQRRNPFSDKASLILRELLKDVQHIWGIRELAQKIELDPGYVSRMARSLAELKYIIRIDGKLKIRSPADILEDWVRAYDLKDNRMHRFFCVASSAEEVMDRLRKLEMPKNIKCALSVQAGASLVAPYAVFNEVHLYVENERGIEYFRKKMELKDSDRGANLILMHPYYRNSAFYDSRVIDGLPVVSDIQLYLDLYGYPVRGREQAEHLFQKRLKNALEPEQEDE